MENTRTKKSISSVLKRKNKEEKEPHANATPCKPESVQVSEAQPNPQGMTCLNNRCGKVFDKPLELIDLAKPSDKSSYVCPYCLSKFEPAKPKPETVKEAVIETAIEPSSAERPQGAVEQKEGKCPQFVGYLSKRPKNVPIPDFCLTCPQMMKCLLG